MTEPAGRFSATGAIGAIGRGLDEAPVLRQGLAVTWLLAAVGAGGRVVVPILIQQAIDRGIVGRDEVRIGFVLACAAVGVVAVLVAGVCQRTAIVRLGTRSEQALYVLRRRLVDHIHRLSLADHNDEQRGALVARVTSDIETLAQFFRWGGLAWLIDGTLMVIVASVMLSYNWLLALIAIGVTIPLFFLLRVVQRHLIRAYDRARQLNGEALGAVGEMVSGAATIRAYGAGPLFAARTREVIGRRVEAQIRAYQISASLSFVGELFAVMTIASVVAVGVVVGPAGGLTAGSVIGFVFLTYRFLEPVAELTEVLDQTQSAVAGLRRVLGVLDIPAGPPAPGSPAALPTGPLEIHVDDVVFAYRSRSDSGLDDGVVLDHITATIPPGEQVALVGSTGSGKTTLGRLIARLADPIAGSVSLGGVDMRRIDNSELRQRLVVVAQEPFLFDDTIANNIRFAKPGVSGAEIDQIVERLGVSEWIESLPAGIDTPVGERGQSLSAGERQLCALLRAGIVDPDVLVLDEATSSVDALTEVRISRALETLAKGRTTIAIAHRLSSAARADRVLVLADGRLVEDGTHADLVAAGGHYQRMFDAWLAATTH